MKLDYTASELADLFGELIVVCGNDRDSLVAVVTDRDNGLYKAVCLPRRNVCGDCDCDVIASFTSTVELAEYVNGHNAAAFMSDCLALLRDQILETPRMREGTRAAQELSAIVMYADPKLTEILDRVGIQGPEDLLPLFTGDLSTVRGPEHLASLLTLQGLATLGERSVATV